MPISPSFTLNDVSGCRMVVDRRINKIENFTPREIEYLLHTRGGIIGQDAAVRAAALIVYNHFEDRPSINLFCGPTGSGKTEIWRAIQHEYGDCNIVIQDASTLSAEGWKGGNKISTIFRAVEPERRGHIILVLDEADKLLEPQYGSNGTNYSDLLQNQLLKMCDHDTLFFGDENGGKGFFADCSGVSVVFLGAFSRLLEHKSKQSGSIGFGTAIRQEYDYSNTEITAEDLIEYGMRAELAGRINRIICMHPLTVDDLVRISQQEIYRIGYEMHRNIDIDPGALTMLARVAVKKGLGARWMKSRICLMLDDLIYENPCAEEYHLEYEPPDADDRRQAMAP